MVLLNFSQVLQGPERLQTIAESPREAVCTNGHKMALLSSWRVAISRKGEISYLQVQAQHLQTAGITCVLPTDTNFELCVLGGRQTLHRGDSNFKFFARVQGKHQRGLPILSPQKLVWVCHYQYTKRNAENLQVLGLILSVPCTSNLGQIRNHSFSLHVFTSS